MASSRTTLTLGKGLEAFETSGRCGNGSLSVRLERMVARYAAVMQELRPNRFPAGADWLLIDSLIGDFQPQTPEDAGILPFRGKQRSRALTAAGQTTEASEVSSVTFKLDQLGLTALLATFDVVEQLRGQWAEGKPKTAEFVEAWLASGSLDSSKSAT